MNYLKLTLVIIVIYFDFKLEDYLNLNFILHSEFELCSYVINFIQDFVTTNYYFKSFRVIKVLAINLMESFI